MSACASGWHKSHRARARDQPAPRAEFCTDNGAMIALAGCMRLAAGMRQDVASIGARAGGSWEVSELRGIGRFNRQDLHSRAQDRGDHRYFDWSSKVKQTVIVDVEIERRHHQGCAVRFHPRHDQLQSGSRNECWHSSKGRVFTWSKPWRITSPCSCNEDFGHRLGARISLGKPGRHSRARATWAWCSNETANHLERSRARAAGEVKS